MNYFIIPFLFLLLVILFIYDYKRTVEEYEKFTEEILDFLSK